MKQPFEVVQDGWPDGMYRRAGERIELTEAQAQYLVLSGSVKPVTAEPVDDIAALTAEAEQLGVKVKRDWRASRIREEIAKAKGGTDGA